MSILNLQQLEITEEEGGALLMSSASFGLQCHTTPAFH
ncbi:MULTISPECIES: class III lanthipeptide [unclassified Streptomyces]|nr:class III lanthipeptide [Streptomyces sp. NBC_01207]